jgi:hypothetical protein
MNKKIIGILICMLLIVTSVPTVESLKIITLNSSILSNPLPSKIDIRNQIQKLLASDGAERDNFGFSISLDSNTALIGAPGDDDNGAYSGSVYVFIRTSTNWTQQVKLHASDGEDNDYFGGSVSLDDDTVLIGACGDDDNGRYSGSAYVFIRNGTTWTQQAKLLASDGATEDFFGRSVSLSGDTALIGAFYDDDNGYYSGSAYIFTRTGTTWAQQTKLLASDGTVGDCFGYSVSLDGDTALIGVASDDASGSDSGSAYVFTRSGTTWIQQAKLLASDGGYGDNFGNSVAISGDTALIGAFNDDDNHQTNSGSAYVFTRTGTTWTQQAKLLASDITYEEFFGYSVSLDVDTALIGAYYGDGTEMDTGSAYVFTRTGTTWIQQAKLIASDGAADDEFGNSVFLAGDTALIGAFSDDNENGFDSGSVYAFTNISENQPPNPPTINGPASGKVGQLFNYTFNSTDPDGDDVYYYIDWGDTSSGWVGPFASGVNATVNHTWTQTDLYNVIAKAKDIYDHESNWSAFTISILQRALLIGLIHNVITLDDYITFQPTLVRSLWLAPFSFNKYSYGLMMISKNTSGFVGKLFIIGMFDATVVTNKSTSISDHLKHLFPLQPRFVT